MVGKEKPGQLAATGEYSGCCDEQKPKYGGKQWKSQVGRGAPIQPSANFATTNGWQSIRAVNVWNARSVDE